MNRKWWLTAIMLCTCYGAFAQVDLSNDHKYLKTIFSYQVKELSEFFDRFNFKEKLVFKNDSVPNRYKNIISLINLKDTSLRKSTATLQFVKEMADEKKAVKLSFSDKDWFAIANCAFYYHGKEKTIGIILRLETTPDDGYYWVIADVQSDLFNVHVSNKQSLLFIDPTDHEIGFSELSAALFTRKNIGAYATPSFTPNPLGIFLSYVQNGDIRFKQVNSVWFEFLQVPGWSFVVKDFFRVDYNSGWLIASVKKMNDEQKSTFKKNHLIQ